MTSYRDAIKSSNTISWTRGETVIVRDGIGKVVERMTVIRVMKDEENKQLNVVHFQIDKY